MNRKQLKFCLLGAVFLFAGCTASDPTHYLESSADTLFQIKPDQDRAALERQSGTDQPLSSKSTIRVLFVTTRQSKALFPNHKIELVQALQTPTNT